MTPDLSTNNNNHDKNVSKSADQAKKLPLAVSLLSSLLAVGLTDEFNFYRHRNMNKCDKHIAEGCLTHDE